MIAAITVLGVSLLELTLAESWFVGSPSTAESNRRRVMQKSGSSAFYFGAGSPATCTIP
jgi:hypothetical protein